MVSVVYFDQRLGAAHSKRWSKSTFSVYLLQKTSISLNCSTKISFLWARLVSIFVSKFVSSFFARHGRPFKREIGGEIRSLTLRISSRLLTLKTTVPWHANEFISDGTSWIKTGTTWWCPYILERAAIWAMWLGYVFILCLNNKCTL